MKLEIGERTLRLRRPLRTAYGDVSERQLLIVTLTAADGAQGFGEAAPLEPYDGVSIERVREALARYAPALDRALLGEPVEGRTAEGGGPEGADPERAGPAGRIAALLDACRAEDDLPAALAAVDLALWDLAGRRAGRPVAELLCEHPAASVPVNATVAAHDRAGAAEQAAGAAREGFGAIKLKVGVGDDAGRVAAARAAAGPHVALRLDANGAWGVREAAAAIASLEPAGLELVEEPTHGLENVRAVRELVSARVAIDETAAEPGAASSGAADAVCLKISRCGGISALLESAAQVRRSGAEAYMASSLDGPLGVAGALHAAAALAASGPLPHCGLATLGLFEDLADSLPVTGGEIALPRAPGLGVAPP
jgi:L-alanine-DL-glutamate epimerase-like enolase superfamily enzyme